MSDISLRIMSSNLVSNDEIKDAKNKEIELARKDGKNNVVLVNKLESGDAVISRLDVGDIADLSVGTTFDSGGVKGQIVFFDDGKDDIIPKSSDNNKTTQAVQTENTASVSTEDKKSSMYALTTEQAYKFLTVFDVATDVYNYNSLPSGKEKIQNAQTENISTREKVEFIKNFQSRNLREEGTKVDGVFGQGTFISTKNQYRNNGKDPYTSDSEFKSLIDDAIKVFDKGMTLEKFLKKWDMEYI